MASLSGACVFLLKEHIFGEMVEMSDLQLIYMWASEDTAPKVSASSSAFVLYGFSLCSRVI